MDQTQEKEQVLIARNNDTGEIGAVTGQNPDGSPQLAEMKSAKLSDLVKFTKGQNPVEAFISNFIRQAKNPSLFGFFKVDAANFDTEGQGLGALLQSPDTNKELIAPYKVEADVNSQSIMQSTKARLTGIASKTTGALTANSWKNPATLKRCLTTASPGY